MVRSIFALVFSLFFVNDPDSFYPDKKVPFFFSDYKEGNDPVLECGLRMHEMNNRIK
ncbi:MAG: hypothetical protein GXO83_01750 [Chlorobi bacterium]|nr:hypothetical protein [Chlorobiota bacterium]